MSIAENLQPHIPRPLPNASLLEDAPTAVSAVAWGAVIAGALGAAALSLILLFLGSGLGFGAASPWVDGMSATGWAVSAIAWLTFTQLAASALGGYLTGRLRVRWVGAQLDEVYFRDTAHGFLSWSLATLLTATLMATAVGSVVSTGVQVGAATAATAVAAGADTEMMPEYDATEETAYLVDALFRKPATATATATTTTPAPTTLEASSGDAVQTSNTEAERIFANAVRTQTLPPEDAAYLGQLVGQRSGLPPADATKRVNDTFARLQAQISQAQATAAVAAEKARKASSYASLWFCVALLAGAFVASLAATFGGRQRDA